MIVVAKAAKLIATRVNNNTTATNPETRPTALAPSLDYAADITGKLDELFTSDPMWSDDIDPTDPDEWPIALSRAIEAVNSKLDAGTIPRRFEANATSYVAIRDRYGNIIGHITTSRLWLAGTSTLAQTSTPEFGNIVGYGIFSIG